ncbi:MAG: energy transducer TonB [Myxococcales bacterium]|nr:MAG: energy transducer TonB [Myxococcales bacterium]
MRGRTALIGGVCLGLLLAAWGCGETPAPPAPPPAAEKASAPSDSAAPPSRPASAAAEKPKLFDFDPAKLAASGGVDPQVFRRVMSKRRSSFKVCYQKALAQNPRAAGEVRIGFTISPTGRVSTVEALSSTLAYPETVDCVLRVVRRVQFPPLESGQRAHVEYPLVFVP